MSLRITSAVLLVFSISASAADLPTLKSAAWIPSDVQPPIDMGCETLSQRLASFQQRLWSLQNSVVTSVYDTSNVMNSWYYQLSAYEGRTVYISYGAFDAIRASANTAANNAQYFQQNFSSLNAELSQISNLVAVCQKP